MSYAIVRTGGKQYRVEEGRSVSVERLPAEEGARVELGEVLLIADDGEVTVGTPIIEGARVLAQVEVHGRDKKIIVFKYKSKVRTRKKTGHRQHFTRLTVEEILRPGQQSKEEAKPKRRRRKKAEETPAEAAVETPTAEAPAPRRRARRAATPSAKAEAPKRRTRRKTPEAEAGTAEVSAEAPAGEAPKRRTRRKAAEPKAGTAEAPAPKRRTRRKVAKAETGTAEASTEEKPKATRRRTARPKTETEETE